MKKPILLVFTFSTVLFYMSCTKDSTSSPTLDCTTVSAKFAADIKPILVAKCGGSACHPANSEMTTYASVKDHYDDGHLKPYVIDRTGSPMPPAGSTQLTTDEINKISCWISAGVLNN